MSGGGWKEPFYKVAQNDSRNLEWLGNATGWDALEKEGKKNKENPGRAITKAAEYAALYYLGGQAAGAFGSGAGEAAAPVVDESAGLAMNAAANTAEQQAAQQALAQAPQGLGNTLEAGMTDTGYTPSSLWHALSNANSANGTGLQSNLLNYGKETANQAQNGGLLNRAMSGGNAKSGQLAQKVGMNMLNPQQPQQQAPMARPAPQGQQAPLQYAYGSPAGNSLGFTEEQKRRLRAQGYQIP